MTKSKACEQTGILIEGMVDSVHWQDTLSHPDPSAREQASKPSNSPCATARNLAAPASCSSPAWSNSIVTYDQCYQRSQEEIRKAIPLAQELGVKIAIEDVWNDFLLSPLEAARYVDEFNNPAAIGWHMDIGNVMAYGYPEQWVHILGSRIVKLHVKDFSRRRWTARAATKALTSNSGTGTSTGKP